MIDSKNTEITIACYLESEWEAWREQTEDGDLTFRGSYQVWQEIVEKTLEEKCREGFVVRRVEIRLADFLTWAKRTNNKTDTSARATYSALIADAV